MMARSQYFLNLFSKCILSEQITICNVLKEDSKTVY